MGVMQRLTCVAICIALVAKERCYGNHFFNFCGNWLEGWPRHALVAIVVLLLQLKDAIATVVAVVASLGHYHHKILWLHLSLYGVAIVRCILHRITREWMQ